MSDPVQTLIPAGEVYTFESLATAEEAIVTAARSYQVAAQAIIDVKEQELWRQADYEDFEDWAWQRFRIKRARASQIESAGRIVRFLAISHPELQVPENEKIARTLGRIKRKRQTERPFDFEETEEEWRERQAFGWQMIINQAENDGVAITADYAQDVIDLNFRGGVRVPKKKKPEPVRETVLDDLVSAFMVITQLKPEVALERFGPVKEWPHFRNAKRWMDKVDGLG